MSGLTGLADLWRPRPGQPRQVSSFDRDPDRGGTFAGLRPPAARRKRILLAPGETHTLASLAGPGLITRLWLTTMPRTNRGVLRDVVLRAYWDDEGEPSVQAPVGDFFGAPFGRYQPYAAGPLSLTSGGYTCLFPMPFERAARIELTNDGPRAVDPIFYELTYVALDEPLAGGLRFHSQWRRQCPTAPGQPYEVLAAAGAGHYVGCQLFMQNREWWLRPPLGAMLFPRGLGLGMLEGQARVWLDGEDEPAVVGTGTEDYFNSGWYFAHGRFCTPTHGCTARSVLRGQVAAYRFDLAAPLPFRRSIRVAFDHGWQNAVESDYASVAYWYQAEPHQSFGAIADVIARRPAPTHRNVLQFFLSAGAPGLMALVLPRLTR